MHRLISLKNKAAVVALLLMLAMTTPIVGAVLQIGAIEVYANDYDAWINDGTIYNGSGDDRAKHSTEDAEEEDSDTGFFADVWKWLTSTKDTVKDSITKFIGWIQYLFAGGIVYDALYQELSFIVLGRVAGAPLVDWNAYQFQMVDGNIYAVIGSTGYVVVRGICLAVMVVYAAWLFFRTAIENTGASKEEAKSRIMAFLVAFAALVFFPNILEVLIYMRDLILHIMYQSDLSKAVYNAQSSVTNPLATIGTMITDLGTGGARKVLYFIAVQVLVLVFQVYYVSVALSMAILMVIAPIVFVMSITDKRLLENWGKQVISALSVPVVDYLLITMVFMINGNEHPWIQLFAAMSIFPIRDLIRQVLGLSEAKNSEMFGVGAMMAAGNLAKLAGMAALTAATAGAGAAAAAASAEAEGAAALAAGEGAMEGAATAAGGAAEGAGALSAASEAGKGLEAANIPKPEEIGTTSAKATAKATAGMGRPDDKAGANKGTSLDDKLREKYGSPEAVDPNKELSKKGGNASVNTDELKGKPGDGIADNGHIDGKATGLTGDPAKAGTDTSGEVKPDEDIEAGMVRNPEADGTEIGSEDGIRRDEVEITPESGNVAGDDEQKVDTDEFSQGSGESIDTNTAGLGGNGEQSSEDEGVTPVNGEAMKESGVDMDSNELPDDEIGLGTSGGTDTSSVSGEEIEGEQTAAMVQPKNDREANLVRMENLQNEKNSKIAAGAELDRQISAQEGAIGQHRQALAKLNEDKGKLNSNINTMEKRLGELKRDTNPGAAQEAATIQGQLSQAKTQLGDVEKQIQQHESAITQASGNISTMRSARSALNGDVRAIDTQIQAHRDRERSYANMEATMGRSAMGRSYNNVGELRQAEYAANVQSQFANVTNFELPQYAGALSHTQRAALYRQKASRIQSQAATQIAVTAGAAAVGGGAMLFMGPRAMAMGASIGGNLGMTGAQAATITSDAQLNLSATRDAAEKIRQQAPPSMPSMPSYTPMSASSYTPTDSGTPMATPAPAPMSASSPIMDTGALPKPDDSGSMFSGNSYTQAEAARQETQHSAVGTEIDRQLAAAQAAAQAAYAQQMADEGNTQYQSEIPEWQPQPYDSEQTFTWSDDSVGQTLNAELEKRGLVAENDAHLNHVQQEIAVVLQDVERAQTRLAGYDGKSGYSSQDMNAAANGRKKLIDIFVDSGMDKDDAADMASVFIPSFKRTGVSSTPAPSGDGLNQPDMGLLSNYLEPSSIDAVDDKLMLSGLVNSLQTTFDDIVKDKTSDGTKITIKLKEQIIDEDIKGHGPIYKQMVGLHKEVSGTDAMSDDFINKIISALKSHRV